MIKIKAERHLEAVNVTWFASGADSQFLPLGKKAASGRGRKARDGAPVWRGGGKSVGR